MATYQFFTKQQTENHEVNLPLDEPVAIIYRKEAKLEKIGYTDEDLKLLKPPSTDYWGAVEKRNKMKVPDILLTHFVRDVKVGDGGWWE